MATTCEREMTISHSDFFRLLPKAIKSYRYQQHDNHIKIFMNDDEICIFLSKERVRKIASLLLPVTDVTFQVENVAKNTQNEFFKQFDRAYQRGGG